MKKLGTDTSSSRFESKIGEGRMGHGDSHAEWKSSVEEAVCGIVHEIINPLSIIQGKVRHLSRALERNEIDLQHFQQELVKISAMSDRISRILTGIRLLNGGVDSGIKECLAIGTVVDEAVSAFQEQFRPHATRFEVRYGVQSYVVCNQIQISQVLVNLLSNACDAVEELEDRWVRLDVEGSDSMVSISVTDSGHGIPTEIVERMATPFFTTKSPGRGMGLGLSLSKKIAADHGGVLSYDPQSANTRFVLQLPKSFSTTRKAD